MPYGIPDAKGGDSPENIKKVDACVQDVLRKGRVKDEGTAIAICKSSLGFTSEGN